MTRVHKFWSLGWPAPSPPITLSILDSDSLRWLDLEALGFSEERIDLKRLQECKLSTKPGTGREPVRLTHTTSESSTEIGLSEFTGINVEVDGYHYVHELTLDQQYIYNVPPLMTLYSGNQPPQEVVSEARYRFYPRGNRNAFMRERHFELKAKLNHQPHPNQVQPRTTQAPRVLLNGNALDFMHFP